MIACFNTKFSLKYQNSESSKEWISSNYQKYNVNWKNFNSNYRPKVDYNNNEEWWDRPGSVLKINNILRNNSENTLNKDQKTRNYLSIVKTVHKDQYPQTARNTNQMVSMVENFSIKPQNSCVVSPQKQELTSDYDNRFDQANQYSNSSLYSNIFKQRRTTQMLHSDRSGNEDKDKGIKQAISPRYFYLK